MAYLFRKVMQHLTWTPILHLHSAMDLDRTPEIIPSDAYPTQSSSCSPWWGCWLDQGIFTDQQLIQQRENILPRKVANPVVIQPQHLELRHPDPTQHLDRLNLVLPEFEGGERREVNLVDADEDGATHHDILVMEHVLVLNCSIFQSLMRGRTDAIR